MSNKRRKYSNKSSHNINNNINDYNTQNSNYNINNTNSILWDEISDEDKQSIELLVLQLKSIIIDIFAASFIWKATMEGIQYILERYDSIEGNEHLTNLEPDMLVLQGTYIFLLSKFINTYISFTRFDMLSNMIAEGRYNYSLQPNYDINLANILNLLVSYYRIRAAKTLVARDSVQPVYGI